VLRSPRLHCVSRTGEKIVGVGREENAPVVVGLRTGAPMSRTGGLGGRGVRDKLRRYTRRLGSFGS
jgi:hypothetical protein